MTIDELDPAKKAFVSMVKHYIATGDGLDEIREFMGVNSRTTHINTYSGVQHAFLLSDLEDWKGSVRFEYTDGVITDVVFIPTG